MVAREIRANYAPLSPIRFLRRAGAFFGNRTAIIYGDYRCTYAKLFERVSKLSRALVASGVKEGDAIAVLALNTPPMIEVHFAAPMIGAKIAPLNVTLDKAFIANALRHSDAKFLLCDSEFYELAVASVKLAQADTRVVAFKDPQAGMRSEGEECEYESLLKSVSSEPQIAEINDENQPLSYLYTSGTTGEPKGVVYSHRGAYLAGLSNALSFGLSHESNLLWTWPLFHSHGLSFIWAVTAVAGKHVCARRFDAAEIIRQINNHNITHFCAAPLVLNMIAEAPQTNRLKVSHKVKCITGGAPPPTRVLKQLEQLGIDVFHQYGTTECYGPATAVFSSSEWENMDPQSRYNLIARQGVPMPVIDDLAIANPNTLEPVPKDGKTLGEVLIRGNTIMAGYLHDEEATETALKDGWFHTGDMAVWHADGSFEIKDRVKDMIISGGENISSVEIEEVLYKHEDVYEAAVVGKPDANLMETPCAFVHCVEGASVSPEELADFCRTHLETYKVPKLFVFQELPKTATGKIRKYALRNTARSLPH